MDDFIAQLEHRLRLPLPGRAAMTAWSPQLAYGRHFAPPPSTARQAAVAVLLYPIEQQWHVALTLRPEHLTAHAGQVSLPGGSLDARETVEAGAWRELEEELGVSRATITPLGQLTPIYIFVSNFFVTPCVAFARERPAFRPSPDEVAEVIEWPLSVLKDQATRSEMWIERRALGFRAPCWEFRGRRVWGASAVILGELSALWA